MASGFDINALARSTQRLNSVGPGGSLDDPAFLQRIEAFRFIAAEAHFDPDQQRAADADFNNGVDLLGSINELSTYQFVTLDKFNDHFLTLDDGGTLGLNLNQTVSTEGPLYLYVAENGAMRKA